MFDGGVGRIGPADVDVAGENVQITDAGAGQRNEHVDEWVQRVFEMLGQLGFNVDGVTKPVLDLLGQHSRVRRFGRQLDVELKVAGNGGGVGGTAEIRIAVEDNVSAAVHDIGGKAAVA